MPTDDILKAAQWLQSQGIVPLPLHPATGKHNGKVPIPGDWPNYQVKPDDFKGNANLGALLGPRSNHLTDVDLDWPEAAALAMLLLPRSWSFGRRAQTNGKKTRLTHMVYSSEGAETRKRIAPASIAGDTKQTIIELRAEGCQTVFPPSVLLPGDRLEWIDDPALTDLHSMEPDFLAENVDAIAGAALLVRIWPDLKGSQHDCTLSLAGACHHAGWSINKIKKVLGALFDVVQDAEARDRLRAVTDTLDNAVDGGQVSGFPTLIEFLPVEVADRLKQWWQLGSTDALAGLQIGGRPAQDVAAEASELPKPKALLDSILPAPPFPMQCLPDCYRDYVADVSDRMQCPPDYVAVGLVICTAGVLGGQIAVRPKQLDDWTEVPNLWGGIVGKPGVMKTPALAEPMDLLRERESEAKDVFATQLTAYAIEKITHEQKLRQIKDGNPASIAKLQSGAPTEPTRKRFIVNDATVEKLADLLAENPNGLLLFRDELTGWLASMESEHHSPDRKFYLECWGGKLPGIVDRIKRGTIDIPRMCLSVLGGIQPGPMQNYLRQALDGGVRNDGLFQRLQLLVWPESLPPAGLIDRLPDTAAQEQVRQVLWRLMELDLRALDALPSAADAIAGKPVQPYLRFAPEAQPLFDAWWLKLQTEIAGSDSEAMQAHLSKYRGLIPSLALLLHLADGGGPRISTQALEKALVWYEYLLGHARRIYTYVPSTEAVNAQLILDRFDELSDPFTLRDVQRKCWTGLRTKEKVLTAIEELLDSYWLRQEQTATGGRPKTLYFKQGGE